MRRGFHIFFLIFFSVCGVFEATAQSHVWAVSTIKTEARGAFPFHPDTTIVPIPLPDTVEIAAGPGYEAGPFKRFIWGDHYRDAWTTKINIPVMQFNPKKGDLDILNITGGVQTVTIIAQDSTGQRFVIRSVQKNPKKSLPEDLQETFATDIAQDQTSASHPYGGLIVPHLAEAAGVYQTTPELRYIIDPEEHIFPSSKKSGAVVMVEEFVNKQWFTTKYGQTATAVIGTEELWEKMRAGTPARIDQRQLVRSRLLDMYIGDWDRHEGQWFWVKAATDSNTVYKPIPLDRDNAFYRSDGVMLGLTRLFLFPKFQNFGEDIQSIKGINLNAQYFDRWFINALEKEEWINIANEMQQSITDSVIHRAVKQWPKSITKLNGSAFTRKLKARRTKLPEFARRYYDILSRQVNVFGSNAQEQFIAKRLPGGETVLEMFRIDSLGQRQRMFHRVFKANETEEIRLYGFDNDDRFEVEGTVRQSSEIQIIGGEGVDTIIDHSHVSGSHKTIWVYDTKKGVKIKSSGEIKTKTSNDPSVNRYEKRSFQYNFLGPLVATGYNEDDGLFLGGGIHYRTEEFRKEPFASDHRFTAKLATRTTAFSIAYRGEFTELIGTFDAAGRLDIRGPNYSSNYFGLGNDTRKEHDNNNFYNYRFDNIAATAELQRNFKHHLQLSFGLGYEYFNTRTTKNRFITSPATDLTPADLSQHHFFMTHVEFSITSIEDPVLPKYGTELKIRDELKLGLNDESETFNRLTAETRAYFTLPQITSTIASRLRFDLNSNAFDFFQANTLGGQTRSENVGYLRGFLRDRFSGRTRLVHNTEIRTKLVDIKSYYLPAAGGIYGFVDEGRVWQDDESSRQWHAGYGGGIWISPLQRAVFTAGVAFSKEETLFTLTYGFSF